MIGNLGDLAKMPGMPSEPTIRGLIDAHADFPIRSRGTNGRSYEFDLEEAFGFIRGLQQRDEEEARKHSEAVRQLGLQLLGEDAAAAAEEKAGLSSAERRALMEEELVAIKLAEKRGELIRKASVEQALGQALVKFQQRLRSLSLRLSKRVDLGRDQITALDRMIEADLGELADDLEKLSDAASTDQGDPAL
jgi:hypothetical protein